MAMELNKLFRSLELKTGNPDEKIEGYLIAIAGASYHALQTTVARIIKGEIDGISKKFCPTPPELATAIRDEMAFVRKQVDLAAQRVTIEDNRPKMIKPLNAFERVDQRRAKMRDEGRKLLFTVNNIDQLNARKRELPKDFGYIALTGEVFGPPGSETLPRTNPR